MILRIAELRIFGLGNDLLEGLFRHAHVARFERHFAQVAQAAHHVRRDGHCILEDLLGGDGLSERLVSLRQQIVGRHEFRVMLDQDVQRLLSFGILLQSKLTARQPEMRPADGPRHQDGLVHHRRVG